MRNWREVLSWEVKDNGETPSFPKKPPSQALLQRYKNTWWQEFVDKYQIDCPYKIETTSFGETISTRLEPWSLMLRSPFNRRELFQCLSEAQAQSAADACNIGALDCIDPRYEVVVERSSMPHYIDLNTVRTLLNKTPEDIQELFQDEKPRGI